MLKGCRPPSRSAAGGNLTQPGVAQAAGHRGSIMGVTTLPIQVNGTTKPPPLRPLRSYLSPASQELAGARKRAAGPLGAFPRPAVGEVAAKQDGEGGSALR